MKIETDSYTMNFDEQVNEVSIIGSLRLNGMSEYAPILDTLQAALENSKEMVLDLSQLEFLNSSGIAMLAKFAIQARSIDGLALTLMGSAAIPWQGKSLKNLQRLFPALILDIK